MAASFFSGGDLMRARSRLLGLLLALFAALPLPASGEPGDVLAGVRRLAAEGAPQLALSQVESLQPPPADLGRWADWESLRIELLERLDRSADLAMRASALPEQAPPDLARRVLLAGAGAALRVGEPVQARVLLARLLWREELPADGTRHPRMMVVETYLGEKRPTEAYRAMLRFQQDYQPLTKAEGEQFATGLVALGAYRDAATWLAYLDGGSMDRLLVQLETGLIAPDDAMAKARVALKKAPSADGWRVLWRAAEKKGDAGVQLEAMERLLNYSPLVSMVSAAALRKKYEAFADEIANREQLLRGEDSAWLNLAATLLSSSPPAARSVLAVLAIRGRSPSIREAAMDQWLKSMERQKLGLAAARYASQLSEVPMASLSPATRLSLGEFAHAAGEAALATDYWRGLPAPEGVLKETWQVRVAAAAVEGGRFDDADHVLGTLVTGDTSLGQDTAQALLGLARSAWAKKQGKPAETWLIAVALRGSGSPRREALLDLGQIAEQRGDHRLAAVHYLQAAGALEQKAPDLASIHARWRAARNLALAGFRKDALNQFGTVQKYLKDRTSQDILRLDMNRL